jgi:hypothetical protein
MEDPQRRLAAGNTSGRNTSATATRAAGASVHFSLFPTGTRIEPQRLSAQACP